MHLPAVTVSQLASAMMLQFGVRMQHMVATASSVLLDVDSSKKQIFRETPALRKAMDLGQTRPLETLMHRMRCVVWLQVELYTLCHMLVSLEYV